MSDWLFPDSLIDPTIYADAQRHWESLWQRALTKTGQSNNWETPWMKNLQRDGNPIFTAISQPEHKGIRIIHEDPEDPDDIDFDFWVDYFGEKTSPDAVRELVIACCPSRENTAEIERLIREWIETDEIPPSLHNSRTAHTGSSVSEG